VTTRTPARDDAATRRDVGLRWDAAGQVSLSGPLLHLQQSLDAAFLLLAGHWDASEEAHPAFLDATVLDLIDYLDAFPQLANFGAALDDDDRNLEAFREGPPIDDDGAVRLTRLAPVRQLLTPAACYHLYVQHRGELVEQPLYLTTRNTCFRREAEYRPLRRQRAFEMREIVCVGERGEVITFLDEAIQIVTRLLEEFDLPTTWDIATDPFFRPAERAEPLFQRVHATKREATYGGDLAIASVNMHEDHFGGAFAISTPGGPATSGCVAFGLDRWLWALTDRHGVDPDRWPSPLAAARAALDHHAAQVMP